MGREGGQVFPVQQEFEAADCFGNYRKREEERDIGVCPMYSARCSLPAAVSRATVIIRPLPVTRFVWVRRADNMTHLQTMYLTGLQGVPRSVLHTTYIPATYRGAPSPCN